MPYINHARRQEAMTNPLNAGELNYALTILFIRYCETQGVNYQTLNDIAGAASEALTEFRRRVTASYEAAKIAENGDVYPPTLPSPEDVQKRIAAAQQAMKERHYVFDASVPEAEDHPDISEEQEAAILEAKAEDTRREAASYIPVALDLSKIPDPV